MRIDVVLEAVARQAEAARARVVRPDRAVVIRHRVVARLARRGSSGCPSPRTSRRASPCRRRDGRARATRCRSSGTAPRSTTRPGTAACRRRAPARRRRGRRTRSAASKGQRRRSASPRRVRARSSSPSAAARSAACMLAPHRRSPAPRRARSGPSASVPSAWKTASCESFQPWLREAALGGAGVLDEPVAVGVAVTIHPGQRRVDVRPQPRDGVDVAGPLVVRARRAARRAASRPRCRNSGLNGISPSAAISPPRVSWRILPGCASRPGRSAWPGWRRATSSTPRASDGIRPTASASAVMMPSRPNIALNHGIPA